jgi:aliphatic sulfonates family ABC transporter substrate-binding protein
MKTTRSTLSSITMAALALAGALAGWTTAAGAADKVVIGEQRALSATVSSVGIAKGFFAEEGLEVTQLFGERPTDTIPAVLAGQVDFSFSATPPFLAATASGADLVAVGVFSHGYSGHLVASKANAKLRTLADFKGKRIGMQRGTGVTNVFLIALERSGLKESDFQITNLRVPDMPTAMQGGTFDAVLGWEPGMSRIVSLGYGERVISAEQFEKLTGITYVFPLFATRATVRNRPDIVQRFMNAWAKSLQFANAHRAESLQILRKTLGDAVKHMSDEELGGLVDVYQKDRVAFSAGDLDDFRIMQDFMLRDGQITRKVDLAAHIDNSFAQKADQKVRAGK